jgi:hypothetical protein
LPLLPLLLGLSVVSKVLLRMFLSIASMFGFAFVVFFMFFIFPFMVSLEVLL